MLKNENEEQWDVKKCKIVSSSKKSRMPAIRDPEKV